MMALSNKITPEYIQQIMANEGIPLRRRSFAVDTVNEIFRYGAIVGNTIEHHLKIPRAMDRARQLIHKAVEENLSFPSGTVIVADEMVQSKGRFKRYWHAPKGGIWLTLVLVNTLLPECNLLVPMAAGVACCEVLRDYGIEAHLKWVNDVQIGSKKISGILSETFTLAQLDEEYVLVGIGINVNNEEFPNEFSKQATSVKSLLHKEVSLPEITARLLVKLRWNIGLLYYEESKHLEVHGGIGKRNETQTENLPGEKHLLLDSYKSLTDIFNRRVLFGFDVQKSPQFEAKVIGLDNSGGLILELDDNSRIVEHSGEIIYLD
jgi:BirA family biotin operon repressor/biotin-[acetyl-CoA-carboxylase] ligase